MDQDFNLNTHSDDILMSTPLHDTNIISQAIDNVLLPDAMVASAVHRACDFFGMPTPASVLDDNGVCVYNGDPTTIFDDVMGFSRLQMIKMGIQGEDSLTLVYTHECAHRALQNISYTIDPWHEELACDFFAGVNAAMNNMDASNFQNALGSLPGGDTHPNGQLRAEFIEYGQQVVEYMQERGIEVSFENCIQFLNQHIMEQSPVIAQCRYEATGSPYGPTLQA